MKRLLIAVTAMSLLVAGCGGTASDSTTSTSGEQETTTTATQSESTTTATTGQDEIEELCADAPSSGVTGEVLCANYHSAASSDVVDEPQVPAAEHQQFACLYVPNQLIVFPALADGDAAALGLAPIPTEEFVDGFGDYLEAVALGWYEMTTAGPTVLEKAAEVTQETGALASPHYVLAPAQGWKYGPGGEAVPVNGGWDDLEMGALADGARVVVIDTGGVADTEKSPAAPSLGVVSAVPESANLPGHLLGHGQFIASIINQYNPGLQIDIMNAGDGNGFVDEMGVIAAFQAAGLNGDEVVNLSLGTYPCTDDFPPLALSVGTALMPHELAGALDPPSNDPPITGTGVVAASGNDGETVQAPMYPARLGMDGAPYLLNVLADGVDFDSGLTDQILLVFGENLQSRVTAVGALTKPATGSLSADWASWSNQAEVYVPGTDVVGWYAPADSLAVWSGTSFAAPRFAACLASGHCSP